MRTHCFRGHEFTPDNTYVTPSTGRRYCKQCKHAAWKASPHSDKERNRLRMAAWRAKNPEHSNKLWTDLRKSKKAWIDDYKRGKKCSMCPEDHPACLDFHHRDPSEKSFVISLGVARASLERIQKEVAKCDLLCSNCHRKLHAAEREKDNS